MVAQSTFKIELHAPSFINDSILLSPPVIRVGLEELFTFKLDTNKNVSAFGARFGLRSAVYQLKVKEKNIIDGQFGYPQPVTFQYFDTKEEQAHVSATFFLDAGSYKIELPKKFHASAILVNSPVNNEYAGLKKLFADLYVKTDNGFDKLTSVTQKQDRLGAYIKQHPDSYVAFWEIVSDYTLHNYNAIYLDNLQLFSPAIKVSSPFKTFESKLKAEQATVSGHEFPTIRFDEKNTLTKEDFKKYKLTFIDYWSTTCLPCIKAMPKIVGMYNEYKDKGVNFITITDENDPQKMVAAEGILQKNKVAWKNYFDLNADFKNKVNANGYPLHFVIDQNGIIVARILGDLGGVKKIIDENLSKP